uniref:Uncharacterized protein n=1 Tax=Ditylenchus dipsaci TaxID=166011 RepID=A0A915EDY7_9BILA
MFQGTPFLKQVSLAYNNIRNIQAFSFAHLANLHTLDLSNNKIQSLQPSAIMGSDFLTVRVQENPMVCSQDGFHVMNGREAINLTTEANLICQTDYIHDVADKCPRRLERPARQPCCSLNNKDHATTTTPPLPQCQCLHPQLQANQNHNHRIQSCHEGKEIKHGKVLRLQRKPAEMAMVPHIKPAIVDSVSPAGGVQLATNSTVGDKSEVPSEEQNKIVSEVAEGHRPVVATGPAHVIKTNEKVVYEKMKGEGDTSEAVNSASVGEFSKDDFAQTVQKEEQVVARRH